jgi:hypothetical protein
VKTALKSALGLLLLNMRYSLNQSPVLSKFTKSNRDSSKSLQITEVVFAHTIISEFIHLVVQNIKKFVGFKKNIVFFWVKFFNLQNGFSNLNKSIYDRSVLLAIDRKKQLVTQIRIQVDVFQRGDRTSLGHFGNAPNSALGLFATLIGYAYWLIGYAYWLRLLATLIGYAYCFERS